MSEVARLLCQAIELRAAAERAGCRGLTATAVDCSEAVIEQATPLGLRRLASNGVTEWDVVQLCGGVLTLSGEHRPVRAEDEHTRSTVQTERLERGDDE